MIPAAWARTGLSPWCVGAVILGVALRLLWPGDMEWKYDERWMFAHGLEIASGQAPLPVVGMASGAKGLVNPGFSVWPFAFAGLITQNPVGMGLFVMALNALALLLFAVGLSRAIRAGETWAQGGQWALAFLSLSPIAILYSRKIWAQDVLLFFLAIGFLGFLARRRFVGSFVFALMAGLMCQVHMSGMFFAAALGLAVLARFLVSPRVFPFHIYGIVLGLLPSAIGLGAWFFSLGHHPSGSWKWVEYATNVLSFKWLTHGVGYVTAIGLKESLGGDWMNFLFFQILGVRSFLPAVTLAVILGTLLVGHGLQFHEMGRIFGEFRRKTWADRVAGLASSPLFVAVVLTGSLLTATGINIQPHYLILVSPFLFLWPAWVLPGRVSKRIFLVALACLSCQFLVYIHQHRGAPRGDYGVTYEGQVAAAAPTDTGTSGGSGKASSPR